MGQTLWGLPVPGRGQGTSSLFPIALSARETSTIGGLYCLSAEEQPQKEAGGAVLRLEPSGLHSLPASSQSASPRYPGLSTWNTLGAKTSLLFQNTWAALAAG